MRRLKLSITHPVRTDHQGRRIYSEAELAIADAELGDVGFPDSLTGKLVEPIPKSLPDPRSAPDVVVNLEGKRYKFHTLENDGSFELRKDW